MSSTTVLRPVYSERVFAPVAANWLTYASIPMADSIAFALTAAIWEAAYYLFVGDFTLASNIRFAPYVLILYAVFALAGLYPGFPISPIEEFRVTLRAVGLSFLIMLAGSFLIGSSPLFSRLLFVCAWLLASVLVPMSRHFARNWCSKQPWWGIPTVILGEASVSMKILNLLQSNRQFGLRPIATLFDSAIPDFETTAASMDVFCGDLSHSAAFVDKHRNSYAILSTPSGRSEREMAGFADHAKRFRRVLVIPEFSGFSSLAVRAKDIHGILGLEIDHNLTKTFSQVVKRAFDVAVCLTLALMLAPVFVCVAVAIKFISPGPILYWQRRIGRNGKNFRLWKFRTMVADADAVLEMHLQSDPCLRAEWNRDHKLRKDPRVTVIGRMLRRTSLDELPQLWNILCGEMSLVGPRPIRALEVPKYGTIFDQYRRVTPGLTGMWQISGRNNTTYERRTQLDDYYVRNWSISLDLYILLRTLKTVVLTEGAF